MAVIFPFFRETFALEQGFLERIFRKGREIPCEMRIVKAATVMPEKGTAETRPSVAFSARTKKFYAIRKNINKHC